MEKNHEGMLKTFAHLKGNARACIWTEPLWGIPYQLYAPFVSLFMVELGLSKSQIGLVAMISLAVQVITSVMSGILADKLGRRRCTLIFDMLSWSVPELLWALSQNFTWFAMAALFNGMWRITTNSWGLLLVEDTEDELVIRLFSLTQLMGLIAVVFAPLSKYAIGAFGLVSTMRFLYGFTCVSMTAKFIILYFLSHETEMGKKRMEKTKDKSIFAMLNECLGLFIQIVKQKVMILTIAITAVYQIISSLNTNYWSLYLTESLHIAEGDIVWFTISKSIIMGLCVFLVLPRIKFHSFKNPTLLSFAVFALGQLFLLVAPHTRFPIVFLALDVLCEAAAVAVLGPMIESLMFINAGQEERARVLGLFYGVMLLPVTLFPWLGGKLADIHISLPFYMNMAMFVLGALLTVLIWREKNKAVQPDFSKAEGAV